MVTEQIELPEDQAEFIREAIASGRYKNVSELVRASIRLMIEHYYVESKSIEELRALIDEGYASGLSDRSPEEVIAEARARIIREALDSERFHDAKEIVQAGVYLLADELDEERRNEQKLRAILDEAAAGGVSGRTPREVFDAVRAKSAERDE